MEYGLNNENRALIIAKAIAKPDGVYTFRGVVYRVRGGKVTHYAWNGRVIQGVGYFDIQVGSYDGYTEAAQKVLKAIQ